MYELPIVVTVVPDQHNGWVLSDGWIVLVGWSHPLFTRKTLQLVAGLPRTCDNNYAKILIKFAKLLVR